MTELFVMPTELVNWRWLLQTLLLTAGLTLACRLAFRNDALSRRSLGVAAVWILAVVPVALLAWQPRYQIGIANPPAWPVFADVPVLLAAFWLCLATAFCLQLLVKVIETSRALKNLPLLADAKTAETLDAFCTKLRMPTPRVALGQCCCASSVGTATLVVAGDFLTWPVTAQRAVIAHELVHLKRRDDRFMVSLQFIARCYLFCPWLHLLYSHFVEAIEEACDERAAELVGCRALYLEGLAEAALRDGGADYDRWEVPLSDLTSDTDSSSTSSVQRQPVGSAALINSERKHTFMQRLARLLGKQQFFEVQSGALLAGLATGLLALGVCTTFEFVPALRSAPGLLHRVSLDKAVPLPSTHRQTNRQHTLPSVEVHQRFPKSEPQRVERYSPATIYPGQALVHGIEGEVLVEFSIAADGTTVHPLVVRSTHPEFFDRAALRAARQTVYDTDHANYQILPKSETSFSGVKAAHDLTRAGGLLAVNGHQTSKVQKLFLFRLNDAR